MRDDQTGGAADESPPPGYAELPTCGRRPFGVSAWRWWLRLVIAGIVVGMTMLHEMGIPSALFWLGSGVVLGMFVDRFVLTPAAVWLARVFDGRRRTG